MLVLEGVFLQETVEGFLSTVERFNSVMRLKFFDASCQRLSLEPDVGSASKNPGSVEIGVACEGEVGSEHPMQ